jgi:hypothetical protein
MAIAVYISPERDVEHIWFTVCECIIHERDVEHDNCR